MARLPQRTNPSMSLMPKRDDFYPEQPWSQDPNRRPKSSWEPYSAAEHSLVERLNALLDQRRITFWYAFCDISTAGVVQFTITGVDKHPHVFLSLTEARRLVEAISRGVYYQVEKKEE